MKISSQYVNDMNGTIQAVQLPLSEWEKVLNNKLKEYEQTLKHKSDLKEAFDQVAVLRNTKEQKQTRTNF